jgi:lipoprotein-releasing system permease protein
MRTIVYLALRQLWAKKGLNAIAMGGVALGVIVLIGVSAMLAGFQQKFLTTIIEVSPHVTLLDRALGAAPPRLARYEGGPVAAEVAHEPPGDRALGIRRPAETMRAIEAMPGVVAASGGVVGSGVATFGAKEHPVEIRGIDPDRQERVTPLAPFVVRGSARALSARADGVLLGGGVAARLGASVGDALLLTGSRGERLDLKVAGVFETGVSGIDNARVYVALRSAEVLLSRPDGVSRIEVRLVDPGAAVAFAGRIERMVGYRAESWQEENASFLTLFEQQGTIMGLVIGAILAVGGFGILAVQIMIVLQKTRDIAILRSVGFRRGDILVAFLLQGAIIALVGAAVGDLAGHYVIVALSHLKTHQEGLVKSETFLVFDDPRFYWYGAGFALFVGLLASVIPALRGSRVEPVDVLRGQI